MKILINNYNKYTNLVNMYNQVVAEEDKITFDEIITEAIKNSIDNADWAKIKHYQYRDGKDKDDKTGWWEPYFYKADKETWATVLGLIPADLKQKISNDDVINFAIGFAKPIELRLKKDIIDLSWDVDRIIYVLDRLGWTDNLDFDDDKITIDCPSCGHQDMAIFINDYGEDVVFKCFGGSCGINSGDIWKLLELEASFPLVVDLVWNILQDYNGADEIKNIDHTVAKKKRKYTNKYIKDIIGDCINKYNYMYKKGFTKALLEECDVLYRDKTINTVDTLRSFMEQSNELRYRICYVVKDISGNVVGIQGRSVIDNDNERKMLVLNDGYFIKAYWDNNDYKYGDGAKRRDDKLNKLTQKTFSTRGFRKSEHLYLLYKYVDRKESISKVVITEGPKDAVKVYGQRLENIAVVSSLGKDLSNAQVDLLAETFGTDVEIVLAYDNDQAGVNGNLGAYNKLIKKGFTKVSFVAYVKWKDFGGVLTKTKEAENKLIAGMIRTALNIDEYKEKMIKKGFSTEPQKSERKKEVIKKETPEDKAERLMAAAREKCRQILEENWARKQEEETAKDYWANQAELWSKNAM